MAELIKEWVTYSWVRAPCCSFDFHHPGGQGQIFLMRLNVRLQYLLFVCFFGRGTSTMGFSKLFLKLRSLLRDYGAKSLASSSLGDQVMVRSTTDLIFPMTRRR